MGLAAAVDKKEFHFTFDARTSRGRMSARTSWFIRLWHTDQPHLAGIGECGPLPGLSVDDRPDMEHILKAFAAEIAASGSMDLHVLYNIIPAEFPSVRFAFETAMLDLHNRGVRKIYDNDFILGKPLPINGLIWMGDADSMIRQAEDKIARGFTTIKLKVGSLAFDEECAVLDYIRSKYSHLPVQLRLDANGAFSESEVMEKLTVLSRYDIHSIEQPLKPGSGMLEKLCRTTPIPVALDEELIGVSTSGDKENLLQHIKPQYIILKPSLHGGLQGSAEWIALAEKHGTGWWITSALESNIGLNAICQFTAQYNITMPQGLGTGQLYSNNFDSPLTVRDGYISSNPGKSWDLNGLFSGY